MLVFPNAKINIGLNIHSKRNDGFHNIESVLFPIKLRDALEIVPSDKCSKGVCSFTNSGIIVDSNPKDNLVNKAFTILSEDYNLPSIDIHLHKTIPFGAGLGGGSSDASYMIMALNELFNLNISNDLLKNYASKLGSDCPFFIDNVPSIVTGRGELMTNIELELKGYYLVLVVPEIKVSTAEAYAGVIPSLPQQSLSNLIKLSISEWKDNIVNDFEKSVFVKYPQISNIKRRLYEIGAVYSSLSGSGSAVYGIFQSKPKFYNEFRGCFVYEEVL